MSELIDLTAVQEDANQARATARAEFIDLTSNNSLQLSKGRGGGVNIPGAEVRLVSSATFAKDRTKTTPRTTHKRPRETSEVIIIDTVDPRPDEVREAQLEKACASRRALDSNKKSSVFARNKVEPATQRCDICFEDVAAPFMHTFGSCAHAFCLQCLRQYVSGKVEGREFPVLCPLPTCKQAIPTLECNLVLTPEEQDVIGKLEAEAAIDSSMKLHCPNARCSQLLIVDERQQDAPLDCPHCSKPICTACGVLWHAGLTCQQFQALPEHARAGADAGLLQLAYQEKWRRCPKCGTMVERIEGCSFIRCKCRHCFCYSCGNTLSPSNHYCTCKSEREQWAPPQGRGGGPVHRRGALPAVLRAPLGHPPQPDPWEHAAHAGVPAGGGPPHGLGPVVGLGHLQVQMERVRQQMRGAARALWGAPPWAREELHPLDLPPPPPLPPPVPHPAHVLQPPGPPFHQPPGPPFPQRQGPPLHQPDLRHSQRAPQRAQHAGPPPLPSLADMEHAVQQQDRGRQERRMQVPAGAAPAWIWEPGGGQQPVQAGGQGGGVQQGPPTAVAGGAHGLGAADQQVYQALPRGERHRVRQERGMAGAGYAGGGAAGGGGAGGAQVPGRKRRKHT